MHRLLHGSRGQRTVMSRTELTAATTSAEARAKPGAGRSSCTAWAGSPAEIPHGCPTWRAGSPLPWHRIFDLRSAHAGAGLVLDDATHRSGGDLVPHRHGQQQASEKRGSSVAWESRSESLCHRAMPLRKPGGAPVISNQSIAGESKIRRQTPLKMASARERRRR